MGEWAIGRSAARRAGAVVSSDQSKLGAHLLECAEREIEVVPSMRCGQLAANARMPLWDNGIAKARYEYAFGEQQLAHMNRLGGLTQDDRHDRRFAGERLEAEREQLLTEV